LQTLLKVVALGIDLCHNDADDFNGRCQTWEIGVVWMEEG